MREGGREGQRETKSEMCRKKVVGDTGTEECLGSPARLHPPLHASALDLPLGRSGLGAARRRARTIR